MAAAEVEIVIPLVDHLEVLIAGLIETLAAAQEVVLVVAHIEVLVVVVLEVLVLQGVLVAVLLDHPVLLHLAEAVAEETTKFNYF